LNIADKTKDQLIVEIDDLKQKITLLENAGTLDNISKEELEDNELKFRTIIQHSPDALFLSDINGNIIEVNHKACEDLGYERKELLNLTLSDIDESFNDGLIRKEFMRILKKDGTLIRENSIIKKNGTAYPAEISLGLIKLDQKEVILGFARDISQRKKIEKEFLRSEKRYRNLFEKSKDAILIIENKIFVDCNIAAVHMLGYTSKEEFLDKHPSELSPEMQPDGKLSLTKAEEMMNIAFSKGSHRFEWDHKRSNGNIFPVEVLLTAISNEDGNRVLYTVWRDITERKQTGKALKDSEKKFRTIFENKGTATGLFGDDGIVRNCNEKFIEITGCSKTEIIGKMKWSDFVLKDDLEKIEQYHSQRLNKDDPPPTHYECSIISKKGNISYVIVNISLMGTLRIVSLTDITERKKAEEALKSSEERLKILFDSAPDAYYINDLKGNFIDGNKAAEELLRIKKEDLIGKNFLNHKFITIKDLPKVSMLLLKNIQGKGTGPDEIRLNRKDGTDVLVEVRAYPVKIENKTVVLGIARDITKRKLAEKALKESESKYKLLIENQSDLIVKVDVKGRFLYASPSYCKLFGKTEEELLDQTFLPLVHKDDIEETEIAMKNLFKPPYTCYIEQRAKTKDGWKWLSWSDTAILDKKNKVIGIIGIGQDISERKLTMEKLRISEEHLNNIIEQSPQAIQILDLEGKPVRVNKAWEELWGVSWDVYNSSDYNILKDEQVKEKGLLPYLQKAYKGDTVWVPPTDYNASEKSAKGKHRWVSSNLFAIKDKFGKILNVICMQEDVTERILAEQEILNEKLISEQYINSLPGLFYVFDEEKFIRWNQKWNSVTGYSDDEISSMYGPDFCVEKDKVRIAREMENVLKHGSSEIEVDILTKDGKPIPYFFTGLRKNLNGKDYLIGLGVDISERRKAKEKLQISELRFRNIFQTAGVCIWEEDFSEIKTAIDEVISSGIIDFRQYLEDHPEFVAKASKMIRVKDINEATLRMLGASKKEEILSSLDKIFVPETLLTFKEELIAIQEGRSLFECETINKTLQGETKNVLLAMSIPQDPNKLDNVLVCITDITDQKKAEEELKIRLKELEIFNEASVDREILVNDHRKEINELLKQLGKKEKYIIVT